MRRSGPAIIIKLQMLTPFSRSSAFHRVSLIQPLDSSTGLRPAERSLAPRGQICCNANNPRFHESENSAIIPFMKTIVVANQKGGSGKSTVAVHLAAAAEQAGDGPVVISDTDPQGTAAD
jgi:Mrp family chromosome partitioning ATPase